MIDDAFPTDSPHATVCPWCSTAVTLETATCPSCKAILISDEERELPGVTAVDQAAIHGDTKPIGGRNRLLSWISGEYPEDAGVSEAEAHAVAPPDPAVQREILRLELEAEVAELQAQADALLSEARAEGRALPTGVDALAAAGGAIAVDAAPTDNAATDGNAGTDADGDADPTTAEVEPATDADEAGDAPTEADSAAAADADPVTPEVDDATDGDDDTDADDATADPDAAIEAAGSEPGAASSEAKPTA